ncbi:indole-3-glycerol phosphate synthase TrpC, partial [Candidatus Aerophobetes bacterium]
SLDKLKEKLRKVPPPRNFKKSVFCRKGPGIIAEIKRFSPSAGILREDLDLSYFARVYEKNGASAISVLIDGKFFGGNLKDLSEVRKASSLPVLAKEFIIDEYQIFEARLYGADAVLLIARVLDKKKLSRLYQLAKGLKISPVIEVHSPEDVEKISHLPPPLIIGINNRDLESFEVNLDVTEKILPLLSRSHLVISESGIKTSADIRVLREKGIRAFLVGEAILRSSNPASKLRQLCHG